MVGSLNPPPNQVTFLYMPLELVEYPDSRGLNRSHLSGFTVVFDCDIKFYKGKRDQVISLS